MRSFDNAPGLLFRTRRRPSEIAVVALAASTLAVAVAAGAGSAAAQAPALDAPSSLPTDADEYGPTGLDIGVLLQVRADFPEEEGRNSTFFLRKAELALKGHVSEHTDFSVELDPVDPDDPFRRTYIRLSHLRRLHVKLGMEKAPLGLDELLSSARVPFVDRTEVNDRYAAAEELGVHLESRWERWLFQFSVTNGGRRLLRDDNDHKDVSARAVWAPLPWASLGVAALDGRAGPEARERERYNVELKLGSAENGVQAELYDATDGDVESTAYYLQLYRAFPLESTWISHLQPAVRYERVDRRDDLREGELDLLTFGTGVFLDGHRSKLQVNYLVDLRSGLDQDELRIQYQAEF